MDKLAIPLYAIRHTQIGGTEFAIYNLIHGLSAAGIETSLYIGRERDLSSEFLSWAQSAPRVTLAIEGGIPGPKSIRFAEEYWFQQRREQNGWALFPNYFDPPKILRSSCKDAVMLHDVQYKCFPFYHSAKRKAWLDSYLPKMFARADLVTLISESELNLVREHFGNSAAEKCEVIYNAIDWRRLEAGGKDVEVEDQKRHRPPYILSVCHQFPHKNVRTLLEAFSIVGQNDQDIELYLVGSSSQDNRRFIDQTLPESISRRVHLTGFVSDASLGRIYAGARLFVLPSLYEGFGMPAVEALGLGVPTIVSRRYALPEVTLGFAHYIDNPLGVEEWAGSIENLLRSDQRVSKEQVDIIRQTYDPRAIAENLVAQMAKRA